MSRNGSSWTWFAKSEICQSRLPHFCLFLTFPNGAQAASLDGGGQSDAQAASTDGGGQSGAQAASTDGGGQSGAQAASTDGGGQSGAQVA